MGIWIDAKRRRFQLDAGHSSYIIEATDEGYLAHWYWGANVRPNSRLHRKQHLVSRPFSPNVSPNREDLSLDLLPQEYPTWGRGDYRIPGYQIRTADGSAICDLQFENYRVFDGKPRLEALPHLWTDNDGHAQTLIITLADQPSGLAVELSYTAWFEFDAVVRSARWVNRSSEPIAIDRALSASLDLPHANWDFIRLTGAWARECSVERSRVGHGLHSVESRRGASSPQANPFVALAEPSATETAGEVYAMNLVYSGNFTAVVEVDQYDTTRLAIGINPFQFRWQLDPGQSFQTPEAVLVYSNGGLDAMSQTYHQLYRQHLIRDPWRTQPRPIVLNTWEATKFHVHEQQVLTMASAAKSAGVEMLVVDDGWFGARDDEYHALGDWTANPDKFPHGIDGLADRVHQLGLGFGLWVEPEMISPDSDLYRAHPDWCLHVADRARSEGRHQLVLDLSRPDVCAHIIDWMSDLLENAGIDYIKWDMNRHMTEVGSELLGAERQAETSHRYILGLYGILDTLTARFPQVLFEGCSGGGGRFDPGMLFYAPQIWTSDNTDAIARLGIQYGTSLVYPPITMAAHVSSVPNQQLGRITPLLSRGWVAMSGNLGYELDLAELPAEALQTVGRQIADYKRFRTLIQQGSFHRLRSPFDARDAAWMFVDPEQTEALVVWVGQLANASPPIQWLRLRDLAPDGDYAVSSQSGTGDWVARGHGGGDELMQMGLAIMHRRDFETKVWHLTAVPSSG